MVNVSYILDTVLYQNWNRIRMNQEESAQHSEQRRGGPLSKPYFFILFWRHCLPLVGCHQLTVVTERSWVISSDNTASCVRNVNRESNFLFWRMNLLFLFKGWFKACEVLTRHARTGYWACWVEIPIGLQSTGSLPLYELLQSINKKAYFVGPALSMYVYNS